MSWQYPKVNGGNWNSPIIQGGSWQNVNIQGGSWNQNKTEGGSWQDVKVSGGTWNNSQWQNPIVSGGNWQNPQIEGGDSFFTLVAGDYHSIDDLAQKAGRIVGETEDIGRINSARFNPSSKRIEPKPQFTTQWDFSKSKVLIEHQASEEWIKKQLSQLKEQEQKEAAYREKFENNFSTAIAGQNTVGGLTAGVAQLAADRARLRDLERLIQDEDGRTPGYLPIRKFNDIIPYEPSRTQFPEQQGRRYDVGDVELDNYTIDQYRRLDRKEISYDEYVVRVQNKQMEINLQRAKIPYAQLTEDQYNRSRFVDTKRFDGDQAARKQSIQDDFSQLEERYRRGEISADQFNSDPAKRAYDSYFREEQLLKNERRLQELQRQEDLRQAERDRAAREQQRQQQQIFEENKRLFGPWWENDGSIYKLPAAKGSSVGNISPWAQKGQTYEQWEAERQELISREAQNRQDRLRDDEARRQREAAGRVREAEFWDYIKQQDDKVNQQAERRLSEQLDIPISKLRELRQKNEQQAIDYWNQRKTDFELNQEKEIKARREEGLKLREEVNKLESDLNDLRKAKQALPELKAHANWKERVQKGEIYMPGSIQEFDEALIQSKRDRFRKGDVRIPEGVQRGQAYQPDMFGTGEVMGNPTPKRSPSKAQSNPQPASQPTPKSQQPKQQSTAKPASFSPAQQTQQARQSQPVKELERPKAKFQPGWNTDAPGAIVKRDPPGAIVQSGTRKLGNDNFKGQTIDVTPNSRERAPIPKQGNLPSKSNFQLPSKDRINVPLNLQRPRNLKRIQANNLIDGLNAALQIKDDYQNIWDLEKLKDEWGRKYNLTRAQINEIITSYGPRVKQFNPFSQLFKTRPPERFAGPDDGYNWRGPGGYEDSIRAALRGDSPAKFRRMIWGDIDSGMGSDKPWNPNGGQPHNENNIPPVKPFLPNGGIGNSAERFGQGVKELTDKARRFMPDDYKSPWRNMTPDEIERDIIDRFEPWRKPGYFPGKDDYKPLDPDYDPNDPNWKPIGELPLEPEKAQNLRITVFYGVPVWTKLPNPYESRFISHDQPRQLVPRPDLNDYFLPKKPLLPVSVEITIKPSDLDFRTVKSAGTDRNELWAYDKNGTWSRFLAIERGFSRPTSSPGSTPAYPTVGTESSSYVYRFDRWEIDVVNDDGTTSPYVPPAPKRPSVAPKAKDKPAIGTRPNANPPIYRDRLDKGSFADDRDRLTQRSRKRDPNNPRNPHLSNSPNKNPGDTPYRDRSPSPRDKEPLNPGPTENLKPRSNKDPGPRSYESYPPIPKKNWDFADPIRRRSTFTFVEALPPPKDNPFGNPKPDPLPPPEDPMPCRYAEDRQVPTQIQYFDKGSKTRQVATFMIHEGLDEAMAFLSQQIADAKEETHKIASALEVDLYNQPTGKPLTPQMQAEIMGNAMFRGAGLVTAKSIPMEMNAWAALNHMLAGHHQLGKTEFPVDMMRPDGAKMKHTTALSFSHWMMNQITNMIGLPSKQVVKAENGTTTEQSFKNQSDAIENIHAQNLGMEQDLSAIEKYLFKIMQALEIITNIVFQNKHDIDVIIDELGPKTKQKIVSKPSPVTHGKNDAGESFFDRLMSMADNFTVVRTWADEIDNKQLLQKTNMEAQIAALTNKWEFDKTNPQLPIVDRPDNQKPKKQNEDEWRRYVNTSENPDQIRQAPGLPIPEIKEINLGTTKEIPKPETNPEKLLGS